MTYTVRELARLACVSVRTLHYYDRIGLLKPDVRNANGYRLYGEGSILPLQQILFFREIGYSLEDIGYIMNRPGFDTLGALQSHRAPLEEGIVALRVAGDRRKDHPTTPGRGEHGHQGLLQGIQ